MEPSDTLALYVEALTEFLDAEEHRRKMGLFGSPDEVVRAAERLERVQAAVKSAWAALTPGQQSKLSPPDVFDKPTA